MKYGKIRDFKLNACNLNKNFNELLNRISFERLQLLNENDDMI